LFNGTEISVLQSFFHDNRVCTNKIHARSMALTDIG